MKSHCSTYGTKGSKKPPSEVQLMEAKRESKRLMQSASRTQRSAEHCRAKKTEGWMKWHQERAFAIDS